ncbi:MAG: arylsulfatase [Blastocatellia bacterium]|nr:arylsulfatase [Blastocatellia bacterium]
MRTICLLSCLFLAGAFTQSSGVPGSAAQSASRPNIVVILADDLGYGDLRSYNPRTKIPTPRLDQLAAEGLRFTDAHSPSAVCTPTRYGLLTGRYPWRSRLKSGVLRPYDPPLIEADRLTLAQMLKQQGYATALVGKWHLGWDWPTTDGKAAAVTPDGLSNVDYTRPIPNGPLTRGFDAYFGTDVPNYPPYVFIENDRTLGIPTEPAPMTGAMNRKGPMVKGWEPVKILPALRDRAVRYVDSRANRAEPFFLYFALTSPHYPVVPSPEFIGRSGAGEYGDFVAQTDAVVGAVLDALKRNGLDRNTLVIFTSDNGPEVASEVPIGAYERIRRSQHASMHTWRGVKRDSWEGGHRVPFLARWPGRIPAGKTSDALIGHVDLMATIAAITGAKLPESAAPDSYNQLPIFLGRKGAPSIRGALVYHQINGHLALRKDEWVFIDSKTCGDGNKEPEWFRRERGAHDCAGEGALYNLRADPAQTRNLYDAQPDRARELKALLEQYRQAERTAPGGR